MEGNSRTYFPGPEEFNDWEKWVDRSPAIRVEEAAKLAEQGEKVVALSISFCVPDIVSGKVPYDSVALVYSGTEMRTPEDLEWVLDRYGGTYWRINPDECKNIARKLFEDGKVRQPRLEGKLPPFIIRGECWLPAGLVEEYEEWRQSEPRGY